MSNQMIEALQGIMNQAQGETLDVPHPVDVKNVEVLPLTAWHNSVLKADREKQEDGDWKTDIVKGRLVSVIQKDDYGEPLGEPKLMLQHKYEHPVRKSNDISVTAVKAHEVRRLRERFPATFQEYEIKLLRERAEIPLALLDSVPPEVIQVIHTMGVRTVREFASFTEEQTATLLEMLHKHKLSLRANYVPQYLERARDMAGISGPEEVQPQAEPDEAQRHSGRRGKQAA